MSVARAATILLLVTAVGACSGSGNYAAEEDTAPDSGPGREQRGESVFGEDGFSLGNAEGLTLFSGGTGEDINGTVPVNRFLWQASLDTLDFLPLESTDPFTGVIATDWSATPTAPNERLKVTVYMVAPQLEASSLRVAVFRERREADGIWRSVPTSSQTVTELEDAILTRARQLRIANVDEG